MTQTENFYHKAIKDADEEFYQSLQAYMGQGSEGIEPEAPLFFKDDGSIDRERTLELPCYWKFEKEN